jgi:tetratricopeptide (TPR) repeat protein
VKWIAVALTVAVMTASAADPCRDGSTALSRADLAGAEKLLKQCVQTPTAPLDSFVELAAVYQLQSNSEALLALALEGTKRFPEDKRFYLTAGTHAGRQKRFEQAVQVLETASRRWPDDDKIRGLLESAHVGRGMELLSDGQNQKSAEHLRRAVELAPDDLEALLNLGRALHNLHRNTEALATFNRVLKLTPTLPLARFHRGMTYSALGEFDKALEDLSREIEMNPDYPASYLVRGTALMSMGDWEKALGDLEIAVAKMPDNARAQYARSRCLIQLEKLEQAEAGLRKTIELDPGDPGPLNALIGVLVRLGRVGETVALREKAAELSRKQRGAP